MDWKLVFDSDFQYFTSVSADERRKILSAFDRLRNNPNRQPDYQSNDSTGRTLFVWATQPFLVTYWLDAFVAEVRVVNIQKIRL